MTTRVTYNIEYKDDDRKDWWIIFKSFELEYELDQYLKDHVEITRDKKYRFVQRIETLDTMELNKDSRTITNKILDALSKEDVEYTGMSWGGFNLFGDDKSIKEVRRLVNVEARVESLEKRLIEANFKSHEKGLT